MKNFSKYWGQKGYYQKKAICAAILGNMVASPVNAEAINTDGGESQFSLEEVVVTASRREQSLQDVPAAIVAADPGMFKDAGLATINDVVAYSPGFNSVSNGQRGNGNITARGVGQQGSTSVVAIYVDDVPMTSNSAFSSGGDLFFDGLLGSLERVELIKGPQGTLWGATAIGGAIRYITKKPAMDEVRGEVSTNVSRIDGGGVSKVYSGHISTPLKTDELGFTISGFFDDGAGFTDVVDPATGNRVRDNADDSETYGVSADLLFQPNDDLSIRLRGMTQKQKFNALSVVDLAANSQAPYFSELKPLYSSLSNDDAFSTQKSKYRYYSGTLEYDMAWATLTSTTSFVKYSKQTVEDLTASFAGLVDFLEGNPPGTTTAIPLLSDIGSDKFVQEIRLTSENSEDIEWLVGLIYADEETHSTQDTKVIPTNFDLFSISFPSDYKETAIFGNVTYYVTSNFDIGFGLRFSDNQTALKVESSGALIGPGNPAETVKDKVSSYLLTGRYRLNEDLSFYARAASGYRPASANIPVINPSTGANLAPTEVKQDNLWSYELGLKGESKENMLSYELSAWLIEWDYFQSGISLNGVAVLGNAEHGVTAKGLEGSLTVSPIDNLLITSTFTYTDSTLDEDEPGLFADAGDTLPRISDWTATTTARYEFSVTGDIAGHVGFGARYVGDQVSAFDNGNPANPQVQINIDNHILFDFFMGFASSSVSLDIYATNLLNSDDFSSVSGAIIPGTTFATGQGVPVRPRTVGMVLSYDF